MSAVLEVRDLYVRFQSPEGSVYAVNGATFRVDAGEWVAILGESGSGKSVTLMAILGLLPDTAHIGRGVALFQGRDLLTLREREREAIRGRDIGVVFQSLASGLNPLMGVGEQIMEPLIQHLHLSRREARERALDLLREMDIPDPASTFRRYVYQLSGGMRQRAMIAAAIACNPALLLADEPTTALDTTVQTQVLAVLQEAVQRRNLTVVMVTHDMGVAAAVCQRIYVMYGGQIVEAASVEEFLTAPRHPYTIALRNSRLDLRHRGVLRPIPGQALPVARPVTGCVFADRCPEVSEECRARVPLLKPVAADHAVACHHVEAVASHVG